MSLSPQWISAPARRGEVAEKILRALPDWFGIEQSTREYVETSRGLPLCAVIDRAKPLGFAALKIHNAYTAEIYVMGVLPSYHRQGLGRTLMDARKAYCRERGIAYLQVKTLDASAPSPAYAPTRAFYLAPGFVPLECFPALWGKPLPGYGV